MMYDLIDELANRIRERNREARGQLVEAMRVSSHGTVPSDVELASDKELATRIAAEQRGEDVRSASQNVFAEARPSQVEPSPI